MIKGTVTSKGQITIPKEVRNFLNLDTEDTVIFDIDRSKKQVTITKGNKVCSLCNGEGYIEGKECFLCEGNGSIESMRVLDEISKLMYNGIKYQVSVGIIQQEVHDVKYMKYKVIPEVILVSRHYSQDLIEKARTYYQIRVIKERLEEQGDKIRDFQQYKLPNNNEMEFETIYDDMRKRAIGLMKTDEGIAAVNEIFDTYQE